MIPRVPLALLAALAIAWSAFAQVGIGDTRESVLARHGKPTSVARRGNQEIFVYPKGGRIEFVDGKVANVRGPLPTLAPAAAVAPPPTPPESTAVPAAATAPAVPAAAPAAAITTVAPPTKGAPPAPTPAINDNPAVAAKELARQVEKMDTAWGTLPVEPAPPSLLDQLPLLLTGLVLRFGIMIVALKLAFKFWEMDAFWKGIFAISGIDLALHATFEFLGPLTGGFTTMTAVENGITGLVLIYTVNRFCFNKRIQNAVITAVAVKTIVTLCYIFVGVAALNILFG